jgi:hypothetical protein
MAPPWVTFDSIATFDGDCAKGSEPDIAGVGVSRTKSPVIHPKLSHLIGRALLRYRELHDHGSVYPGHVPRSSLR